MHGILCAEWTSTSLKHRNIVPQCCTLMSLYSRIRWTNRAPPAKRTFAWANVAIAGSLHFYCLLFDHIKKKRFSNMRTISRSILLFMHLFSRTIHHFHSGCRAQRALFFNVLQWTPLQASKSERDFHGRSFPKLQVQFSPTWSKSCYGTKRTLLHTPLYQIASVYTHDGAVCAFIVYAQKNMNSA